MSTFSESLSTARSTDKFVVPDLHCVDLTSSLEMLFTTEDPPQDLPKMSCTSQVPVPTSRNGDSDATPWRTGWVRSVVKMFETLTMEASPKIKEGRKTSRVVEETCLPPSFQHVYLPTIGECIKPLLPSVSVQSVHTPRKTSPMKFLSGWKRQKQPDNKTYVSFNELDDHLPLCSEMLPLQQTVSDYGSCKIQTQSSTKLRQYSPTKLFPSIVEKTKSLFDVRRSNKKLAKRDSPTKQQSDIRDWFKEHDKPGVTTHVDKPQRHVLLLDTKHVTFKTDDGLWSNSSSDHHNSKRETMYPDLSNYSDSLRSVVVEQQKDNKSNFNPQTMLTEKQSKLQDDIDMSSTKDEKNEGKISKNSIASGSKMKYWISRWSVKKRERVSSVEKRLEVLNPSTAVTDTSRSESNRLLKPTDVQESGGSKKRQGKKGKRKERSKKPNNVTVQPAE